MRTTFRVFDKLVYDWNIKDYVIESKRDEIIAWLKYAGARYMMVDLMWIPPQVYDIIVDEDIAPAFKLAWSDNCRMEFPFK